MGRKLNLEIKPVETPLEVVKGSDIVGLATNSIEPIFKTEWLREGMHLTCVKPPECEPDVYRRVNRLVVNLKHGYPDNYYLGQKKVAALEKAWATGKDLDLTDIPLLADIVTGKEIARQSESETNCFLNNIGLGFQFAAVAGRVFERAKEKKIGHELPLEWFTQPVHP